MNQILSIRAAAELLTLPKKKADKNLLFLSEFKIYFCIHLDSTLGHFRTVSNNCGLFSLCLCIDAG